MVRERQLKVSVIGDASDIDRMARAAGTALGNVERSATQMARGVATSLGIVGASMTALGLRSVQMASDAEESLSKVRAVFGDSAAQIERVAAGAATAMGMSRQEALESAGTFGNLFRAMGLGTPLAAQMSTNILQLAADLGSFNNLTTPEVLEKIRAGLVGEAEPLRALGVNLNAAAIEQEAVNLGLRVGNGELSAAAKAQAAYSLIVQQTSIAQGDWARTNGGMAGQTKILAAELANAQVELGTKLLPLFVAGSRTAVALAGDLKIVAAGALALAGAVALATVPITGPGGIVVALGLMGGAAVLMQGKWETAFAALPPSVLSALAEIVNGFQGTGEVVAGFGNLVIGTLNAITTAANITAKALLGAAAGWQMSQGNYDESARLFERADTVKQFAPIPYMPLDWTKQLGDSINNARLDQRAAAAKDYIGKFGKPGATALGVGGDDPAGLDLTALFEKVAGVQKAGDAVAAASKTEQDALEARVAAATKLQDAYMREMEVVAALAQAESDLAKARSDAAASLAQAAFGAGLGVNTKDNNGNPFFKGGPGGPGNEPIIFGDRQAAVAGATSVIGGNNYAPITLVLPNFVNEGAGVPFVSDQSTG